VALGLVYQALGWLALLARSDTAKDIESNRSDTWGSCPNRRLPLVSGQAQSSGTPQATPAR
jgi:hypothetical protein